jgi:hypothetical protein
MLARPPRKQHRYDLEPLSGCWLWALRVDQQGYGVVRVGGRLRKAHRVEWEKANGPVPEGLQLDHLCRNRSCVNPAHLEPVTHAENGRRGASAKLNATKVITIKEHLANGVSQTVIAAEFGVSPATINHVARGVTWASVGD